MINIDLSYLKSVTKEDSELFDQMLEGVKEDIPNMVNRIDRAFESENWREIYISSHTLKTTISYLSLYTLVSKLQFLEDHSYDDDKSHLFNFWDSLKWDLLDVAVWLDYAER